MEDAEDDDSAANAVDKYHRKPRHPLKQTVRALILKIGVGEVHESGATQNEQAAEDGCETFENGARNTHEIISPSYCRGI